MFEETDAEKQAHAHVHSGVMTIFQVKLYYLVASLFQRGDWYKVSVWLDAFLDANHGVTLMTWSLLPPLSDCLNMGCLVPVNCQWMFSIVYACVCVFFIAGCRSEDANKAFSTAVQMYDTLVKAWAHWGDYLENLFTKERSAPHSSFSCLVSYLPVCSSSILQAPCSLWYRANRLFEMY